MFFRLKNSNIRKDETPKTFPVEFKKSSIPAAHSKPCKEELDRSVLQALAKANQRAVRIQYTYLHGIFTVFTSQPIRTLTSESNIFVFILWRHAFLTVSTVMKYVSKLIEIQCKSATRLKKGTAQ